MKSKLTFILLVLVLEATGQIREKIFGHDFRNNIDIKGTEQEFKDYIKKVYADSISRLVTLQFLNPRDDGKWLTDDGSVAVYDPDIKRIRWSTGINYQKGGADQIGNLIFKSNFYEGNYILDLESGKILWETKNGIYYNDPKSLMGFMFSNSKDKENSNKLIGVNLTSGKEIWTRQLNREDELGEILKLSDSVVVVVASGLHTYNLNTGGGWDYLFVTSGKGKQKYIVSNIVLNNSKIFIASKESLMCLDQTGKVIWRVPLPEEFMSRSHLFIKNKTVYLVNRGLVNPGAKQVAYGKSFFAGYELENGIQKFFTPFTKKELINGLEIQSQSISLISENSIMKYSLKDGTMIAQQSYDENETGALRYFAGDLRFPAGQKIYIRKTDSVFYNLISSDTAKQFVVTTKQKALILNDQLKIEGQIAYEDLYFHFGSLGEFKLLNNAKNVWSSQILDKRNKQIAEIEASYSAMLIGSTLYDANKTVFTVIDLSGVIKK